MNNHNGDNNCPAFSLSMLEGSYRQDAVSLSELSAEISWASCKNEGDEDPFSILSSDNIKPKTRGTSLKNHPPGFSKGAQIWHILG